MDKQKQIEEIYDDISERLIGVLDCEKMSLAIYLHNVGYQKIPEGAVVLTREEFEKHKGFSREEVDEISETAIKNARKETAEKFASLLTDGRQTFDVFEKDTGKVCDKAYIIPQSCIDEICKKITESKNGETLHRD